MKNIFYILLLLPTIIFAQYPSNGNQKITLGEQTTADGLIWRGVAADTTLTVKSDTAAYFVLDTANLNLYTYKVSATGKKWIQLGSDTTSLNLVLRFAAKLNISDTASMLTPYFRKLDTINIKYVNTYGTQTVNGLKTFKDSIYLGNVVIGKTKQNNNSVRFGLNAGLSTGDKSVAIGTNTLQKDTGGENVAIGFEAGKNLTTGLRNMLLGSSTGANLTTGSSNVAFGSTALLNCSDCAGNTAIGRESMELSTSGGDNNTYIGYSSGYSNTTGDNNSSIGFLSGYGVNGTLANTTGSNNTFIGYQSANTGSTISNTITLGNSSIATIRAQVTTITSLSDIRDKTNITPLNYGIDFIKKLNPVSFDWDMRDGGKIGISEIGFIAQELQQAQIDSQINIPNLVSDINPDKLEASYGVLIPIIVKALKEQQALIDELKQRILNLENK
jgi:hypothetical protein